MIICHNTKATIVKCRTWTTWADSGFNLINFSVLKKVSKHFTMKWFHATCFRELSRSIHNGDQGLSLITGSQLIELSINLFAQTQKINCTEISIFNFYWTLTILHIPVLLSGRFWIVNIKHLAIGNAKNAQTVEHTHLFRVTKESRRFAHLLKSCRSRPC